MAFTKQFENLNALVYHIIKVIETVNKKKGVFVQKRLISVIDVEITDCSAIFQRNSQYNAYLNFDVTGCLHALYLHYGESIVIKIV